MGMRFQVMRRCHRTASEQRYIWASMEVFSRLPLERREAVRSLIGELAETPEEGRALFDVAVRGIAPARIWERTGIPVQRLYRLREGFYDRLPL